MQAKQRKCLPAPPPRLSGGIARSSGLRVLRYCEGDALDWEFVDARLDEVGLLEPVAGLSKYG